MAGGRHGAPAARAAAPDQPAQRRALARSARGRGGGGVKAPWPGWGCGGLESSRRGSRLPRPLTPPGIRFRTTAVHEERLSTLDRIEYRDQALLLEPFPWQGLIYVRGAGVPPRASPVSR